MTSIPKNHPRAKSLYIREKLVRGFENGLVAKEGLMAHGRGEMFDYLLGEKTTKQAKQAIKAAASMLLLAESPVISVNGNIAALCPKEIIQLSNTINAKIEINLFYANKQRKKIITDVFKNYGAKDILGTKTKNMKKIPNLKSSRRFVDKNGIYSSDVVLVPLEDGDRTIALKKSGKKVITFDLNPLSRTAQTADITIVDNIMRGINELIKVCKSLKNKPVVEKKFNNKKNLSQTIQDIRKYLLGEANHA